MYYKRAKNDQRVCVTLQLLPRSKAEVLERLVDYQFQELIKVKAFVNFKLGLVTSCL